MDGFAIGEPFVRATASQRRWINHRLINDQDRLDCDAALDAEFGPMHGMNWTDYMWAGTQQQQRDLHAHRARVLRAVVNRKLREEHIPPSTVRLVRRPQRDPEFMENPAPRRLFD